MITAPKRFSVGWFITGIVAQVAAVYLLVSQVWPVFWAAQLHATFQHKLSVFIPAAGFLCFFEWFYHRYVLHRKLFSSLVPILRFIERQTNGHRDHHASCPIFTRFDRDRNGRIIINRYPIDTPDQYANSSFPPYALAAFGVLFTLPLLLFQFLLPDMPVMSMGYLAIVCSISEYETVHAIEHLPYKMWKSLVEHKVFGRFWRMLYGHHHMHHFFMHYNENISGFFLFPLADIVLGTYCRTVNLLLDGNLATVDDYVEPKTPGWIKWLDAKAMAIETAYTHRQRSTRN